MSNCADVRKKLIEYLEEGLPSEQAQELRGHIAHCGVCRFIVSSARHTLQSDLSINRRVRRPLKLQTA